MNFIIFNKTLNSRFFNYIPFIIFFILLLTFHIPITTNTADDIAFAKGINTLFAFNDNNFVVGQYMHWSSRVVSDFLSPIFCNLPGWVWKVLDSLILLVVSVLMPRLFSDFNFLSDKKKLYINSISVFLCLLFYVVSYSYELQSPAGYITTTLNYVWPFCFSIIHFYLVKEYVFKSRQNGFKRITIYFLLFFSLIFAINEEIMAFVILGSYVFIASYLFYKKMKIPKLGYLIVFVVFLGILFHILSPGNNSRHIVLVGLNPEFLCLTFGSKIYNGLLYTFILLINDFVSYIFFGVIGVYMFITSKNKKIGMLGFIPFIFLNFIYFINYVHFESVMNLLMSENNGIFNSNIICIFFVFLFILIVNMIHCALSLSLK
ncbi:MAG: DUF6056 family protein [Methanobrevibacter sp.]|nr:DUF6056 family protein [Candidatus Methanovirga procula]